MVDKASPIPIYYQIQGHIRGKIKTNEWAEGETIPSERLLSEEFGVSRMTVRQAIQGLVDEGILTRKRGSGTYVSKEKVEQPLYGVTSFTTLMEQRGMQASSRLISFAKRMPDSKEAEKLQISETDDVFHIERIRLGDDLPIAIETAVVPCSIAEGLTEEAIQKSLYEFIEMKLGQNFGEGKQSIEAISASEKTAELIDVPVGSPILHIERITTLKNGVPFEYVRSQYAGNRFKFYL